MEFRPNLLSWQRLRHSLYYACRRRQQPHIRLDRIRRIRRRSSHEEIKQARNEGIKVFRDIAMSILYLASDRRQQAP